MINYKGFLQKSYFSRYSKDRVIDDSNNLYLEYDSKVDLSSIKYVYHTITSKDFNKLPMIANTYYGNPLYWWMIAVLNDIHNPFETPSVGSQIKIPYRNEIVRLYNSLV